MQTTPAPSAPMPIRKATAGFAISLIAGILILINGLAWFALSAFISSLTGMGIPNIAAAATGVLGGIGLLCGVIVIIGAILIYMPGKEVVGGILVIIFSIISIVSLGGFFIGLILGIIGGALGIAKK